MPLYRKLMLAAFLLLSLVVSAAMFLHFVNVFDKQPAQAGQVQGVLDALRESGRLTGTDDELMRVNVDLTRAANRGMGGFRRWHYGAIGFQALITTGCLILVFVPKRRTKAAD